MEGTYRNTYYGQSYNHNNKIVNLNGVSNLKLLADPDATTKPILQFDALASNPSSRETKNGMYM